MITSFPLIGYASKNSPEIVPFTPDLVASLMKGAWYEFKVSSNSCIGQALVLFFIFLTEA